MPIIMYLDLQFDWLQMIRHEQARINVGLSGNIGVGATTGFIVGGPVGAAVGATVCLGTWFVGEVIGAAVDKALSQD